MSKTIHNITEFNELLGFKSLPLQHRCALCNNTIGPALEYDGEYNETYEYFIPCVVRNSNFYCKGH